MKKKTRKSNMNKVNKNNTNNANKKNINNTKNTIKVKDNEKKSYYKNVLKRNVLETKNFLLNNKLFLVLFFISTAYFLFENITTISWDLSVYVLNAQHMFSESIYLEIGRPPMASFILGLLGIIFGWVLGEILFVVFTCILFAYAIYKLSKALNFNPLILYALSLNTYLFTYGLAVGTEILSLSFLIIAVNLLIKNNAFSGLFVGLTALTRYTALALFPLAIFHFNTKRIIQNLIIFGLTIFAWLTYNYFVYGNMFESIANQYALNVISRAGTEQPINMIHFLEVTNILLPFFLFGLIIVIRKLILSFKKKNIKKKKTFVKWLNEKKPELIMLFVLVFTTYNYLTTPVKIPRYLFFLVLPLIYFSYIGLKELTFLIKKKNYFKKIALALFIISMLILIISPPYYDKEEPYAGSIIILEELNVSHCQITSNVWPYINYLGIPAAPFTRPEFVEESIKEGKILHLFKSAGEPEYVQNKEFMDELPILYEDNNLYVVGLRECAEAEPIINKYLDEIKESVNKTQGYEPNTNPCFIMFRNHGFLERTCNFMHGKGLTLDLNRALW